MLSAWLTPPILPLLKIYVFNITNPEQVLSGLDPVTEELGPYVYSATHLRRLVSVSRTWQKYIPWLSSLWSLWSYLVFEDIYTNKSKVHQHDRYNYCTCLTSTNYLGGLYSWYYNLTVITIKTMRTINIPQLSEQKYLITQFKISVDGGNRWRKSSVQEQNSL